MNRTHILLATVAMTAALLSSTAGMAASIKIGGNDGLVSVDSG